MPDEIIYINPVVDEEGAITTPEQVNFPTLWLIHPEPKGVYYPSPACNSSHQQTLLFGDYLFGSEEYLRQFKLA